MAQGTTIRISRWVSGTPQEVWDAYVTPEKFVDAVRAGDINLVALSALVLVVVGSVAAQKLFHRWQEQKSNS